MNTNYPSLNPSTFQQFGGHKKSQGRKPGLLNQYSSFSGRATMLRDCREISRWRTAFSKAPHYAEYLAAVSALDRFAQKQFGKRVIHLAARWVLDRAPNTIALWGARSIARARALYSPSAASSSSS